MIPDAHLRQIDKTFSVLRLTADHTVYCLLSHGILGQLKGRHISFVFHDQFALLLLLALLESLLTC